MVLKQQSGHSSLFTLSKAGTNKGWMKACWFKFKFNMMEQTLTGVKKKQKKPQGTLSIPAASSTGISQSITTDVHYSEAT